MIFWVIEPLSKMSELKCGARVVIYDKNGNIFLTCHCETEFDTPMGHSTPHTATLPYGKMEW